ncbi:MAG: adenylyltransferase/cytidyltransferase family protein [Bacteroidales bacterium]|nr:adenylyltransferase/cytidyltransferase family protein [Bacteroidales bacterium]
MPKKKIFVSGCFDLLHSGHVAFFEEAATHGDVYVGLGSDNTIYRLKNRKTVYSELERLYLVKSLKFVKDAWINSGSGTIDFLEEIRTLKPDILFVNEDGDAVAKKDLCLQLGIEYLVSKRIPKDNLPGRSTTDLRTKSIIPYRLDLAGGWLDQPFVSGHYPGPVITISIEPTIDFNDRSGMSSSTRKKALEIWGYSLPQDDPEKLAKILFGFENPPGKKEISGSQDSIGILFPGLNKLNYKGEYWPESIESCLDDELLNWLETHLFFIPLSPRAHNFDVLAGISIDTAKAKALSDAAEDVWKAIHQMNLPAFGKAFTSSFEAQVAMFPNMINRSIQSMIAKYQRAASGWKLSGAGGGGYLVMVSDKNFPGALKIKIRRNTE